MNMMANDTIALFGMPITNVGMEDAVSRVQEYILSGKTHQIATANLDFARNSLRDPYLHRIICECSMVLPDGAPMLWASRMFGSPLRERVTGVDLVPQLAGLSAERGYGIYLLGSSEESSKAACEVLQRRYPGVRIVGRYCPPVAPLHEMNHEEIIGKIREAKPQIVLVGFGNPKQEIWIHRHKDRLPAAVLIGIGGSLDMLAGSLRRAPKWVRTMQMEWMYRMLQEPKRLLPRYMKDALALFTHLPMGLAANRMQPGERRQRGSAVDVRLGVRVFKTPGKMGGRAAAVLVQEAKSAAKAGETLVVDMSATLRVEAEGIGGLLEARRVLLDEGLWIWLTAMSNPVRRVLQFSAVADLFRVAQTPAAAIQFTRSSQSGLRSSLAEPMARPKQVHPEAKTAAVKAS
jgi:N-acetylglucosaminyldiphosphoundecaprenol N-acetyl-beta-D-mannosaminyltransferase